MVKKGKWERVDSHQDSAELTLNGEDVGEILKNHGSDPSALSMTETRGRKR